MISWIFLLVAGLFEIIWAIGLKESHGFTKLWPSVITVLGMIASVWLLALALKHLPVGTAYAIWTGIGAAGTVIIGMCFFGEPVSALRIGGVAAVVGGIIALKLAA